ncbi:MAG: TIGR04338 family metallohydrolase [Actinomycetota bacterium]|nr:TIGR04338 family metallohydrolase [Actinomycetota bacterium]
MPASVVYAAEDQWAAVLDRGGVVDFFGSRLDVPPQRRFGDLAAVQTYVSWVLQRPAVLAEYPEAGPVVVRERAGQSKAHYEAALASIAIPMRTAWAARESVVLHEVAHHLACSVPERGSAPGSKPGPPSRRQWHGIEFRRAMCRLAEVVLGEPAALLLRAGYEEAGLRTVAGAR